MARFVDVRPLPGGPPSVELVNTRWRSSDGPVDWLVDNDAVAHLATCHGVDLSAAQIEPARAALLEARATILRLFASVSPVGSVTHDASVDDVVAEMNAILARADTRMERTDDGLAVVISSNDNVERLAIEAVVDAIDVAGERPERLRVCEHADCVLWFLDTSKAGRRRWCSMESCGNRAKAKRHYARTAKASESA